MNTYTFLYSTNPNKTNQKKIQVSADNSGAAYAMFIQGLTQSATLVINLTTKERII